MIAILKRIKDRGRDFKFFLRPKPYPDVLSTSWTSDILAEDDLTRTLTDHSLQHDVRGYLKNLLKEVCPESPFKFSFDSSQKREFAIELEVLQDVFMRVKERILRDDEQLKDLCELLPGDVIAVSSALNLDSITVE